MSLLPTSCSVRANYFCSQDGTPIWGQRNIDGPGVWVTCVKGKEKQAVGELYEVFESVSDLKMCRVSMAGVCEYERRTQLANQLWPRGEATEGRGSDESDNDGDAEDLEKQIAKEVASMKRPRRETRFGMSPCIICLP